MAIMWYYQHGGAEFGPVTSAELRTRASSADLLPNDLVRKHDMTSWVQAEQIKGLFEPRPDSTTSPPVTPAPPSSPPLPATSAATEAAAEVAAEVAAKMQSAFKGLRGLVGGAVESIKSELATAKAAVPATKTGSETQASQLKPAVDIPVPKADKRLPTGVSIDDVIHEVRVAYQGGHPHHLTKAQGVLYLLPNSLFFAADCGQDIDLPYGTVVDIAEPRQGTYPQEMIDKSQMTKKIASAGRLGAQFLGSMIGDLAGQAVRAAGATAAIAAHETSALGAPPKNRLYVVVADGEVRHKAIFDVVGTSKGEMESQADAFWRLTSSVRSKFWKPATSPFASGAKGGARAPGVSGQPCPAVPASSNTSTGLRISRGGVPSGPYSLADIRRMIENGELGSDASIGIEVWVPVATLGFLSTLALVSSPSAIGIGQSDTVSSPLPKTAPSKRSVVPLAAAAAGGVAAGAIAASLLASEPVQASEVSAGTHRGVAGIVLDTDGDGRPDTVGLDTDHDGVIDAIAVDRDGDGSIDAVAMDTDHDGTADAFGFDTDGDGDIDVVGQDIDGDGDIDAMDEV